MIAGPLGRYYERLQYPRDEILLRSAISAIFTRRFPLTVEKQKRAQKFLQLSRKLISAASMTAPAYRGALSGFTGKSAVAVSDRFEYSFSERRHDGSGGGYHSRRKSLVPVLPLLVTRAASSTRSRDSAAAPHSSHAPCLGTLA